MSLEYVVLRQVQSDPELWHPEYVDVEGENEIEAIKFTAIERNMSGLFVAVPNKYWVGQNVTIKRIAEVGLEPEELI